MRFSAPSAAALEGLERVPGVTEVGYDGATADVTAAPDAVVHVAAELARRELRRLRLHRRSGRRSKTPSSHS